MVRFLFWVGVGRTTYFSNKIQNEKNLVLFLHKDGLKCSGLKMKKGQGS